MNIPKIIHFIWIQGKLYENSPHIKKQHEEMKKELGEKYKFIIWDDNTIVEFLKKHDEESLSFYKESNVFAQKSDIARYIILQNMGGIYIDIDIKIKNKILFESLFLRIKDNGVLLSQTTCAIRSDLVNYFVHDTVFPDYETVQNNIIIATPKHKLFEDVRNHFLKNKKKSFFMNEKLWIMKTTGPFMLSKLANKNENIYIFKKNGETFEYLEQPNGRIDWSENVDNKYNWISYNLNILSVVVIILLLISVVLLIYIPRRY